MNRRFIFYNTDRRFLEEILNDCIKRYMIDSYDITTEGEYCYLHCDTEGLFKRYYNFFKCNGITFSL